MLVLILFLWKRENRSILSVKSVTYVILTAYGEALQKVFNVTSIVKQVGDALQKQVSIVWQITCYYESMKRFELQSMQSWRSEQKHKLLQENKRIL